MITKFITEVKTVFNPFNPKAKTARLFLSFLPPDARSTMKINTKLLPRASKEPAVFQLKFSTFPSPYEIKKSNVIFVEDGKEMTLNAEKLGINGVMEEVDRHSRQLLRQEELNGN